MEHKAGFANIIGRPNVGKSTLMNQLMGEKFSIVTSKAQTTRHRILGILNGSDYQVVISDTPGIIYQPKSGLHKAMNDFVRVSFEDADILLFITEIFESPEDLEEPLKQLAKVKNAKKLLLINKVDLAKPERLEALEASWAKHDLFDATLKISALTGDGVSELLDFILANLPVFPPYYDKDTFTDKPERFFVDEFVREKIFKNYKKEIPYAAEVVTESFKEDDKIIRIRSEIYVERPTQKSIIIGKNGEAIKKVGIEARKDLEDFFGKQIYLELFVKVKEKWRDNPNSLKNFGYTPK